MTNIPNLSPPPPMEVGETSLSPPCSLKPTRARTAHMKSTNLTTTSTAATKSWQISQGTIHQSSTDTSMGTIDSSSNEETMDTLWLSSAAEGSEKSSAATRHN